MFIVPDVFLRWDFMNDWLGLSEVKEALESFGVFTRQM